MFTKEKNIIRICLVILYGILFIKLEGQNMDKHKWQNRILIIKTSSDSDLKYKEQLKELDDSNSGLKERKLILYQIVGDKYKTTNFEDLGLSDSWEVLKNRNNNIIDGKGGFEVVLIGLDGGVKLQKQDVVLKKELYGLIDKMPMRLKEIRNGIDN